MLQGAVDEPINGQAFARNRVIVRGWAVIDDAPADSVVVSTAGAIVGVGRTGVRRGDVAVAHGEPNATAGFEILLEPERLTEGATLLAIHALSGPRTPPQHVADVGIFVGPDDVPFFGQVDDPADGCSVTAETVTVRGWALDARAPVRRIEVLLDGRLEGLARLGLHRTDIGIRHPVAHASTSGWSRIVELPDGPRPRSARIEVVAVASDEERWTVARRELHLEPESEGDDAAALRSTISARRDRTAALLAGLGRPARTRPGWHVLAVAHDLGRGGAQLWLQELIAKARGVRPDITFSVVAPTDGSLRAELEGLGVDVRVDGSAPPDDPLLVESRTEDIALHAVACGADVILANTYGMFIGVDAAQRVGLPSVWTIHESFDPRVFWDYAVGAGNHSSLVRERARAMLAKADHLVFVAESTRQLFAPHAKASATTVVPYGIDLEFVSDYVDTNTRADARALVGLHPDRLTILVIGTVEPRKAQVPVVQAFSAVAHRFPDVELAIVGDRPSDYSDGLKELADRTGIGDRVRIVPLLDDVRPWYRASDVVLCASDVESLPRTVIEAMAYGVPVLATAVFGLAEVITDGVDGFLFTDRDTTTLSEAIERVLAMTPEARATVAAAAHDRAKVDFDSHDYARSISELLTSHPPMP